MIGPNSDPTCDDNDRLRKENAALLAFKSWVHGYLDSKGIPTHPDGPHGKEGCRIGDRMDYVFAEVERLRAAVAAEREACAKVAETHRHVDKYREQYGWPWAQREIAGLIRARGDQSAPATGQRIS